jgi:transcriptional regulator with PAS, ATPase and Fis domain
MKILIVYGTRPEYLKIKPLLEFEKTDTLRICQHGDIIDFGKPNHIIEIEDLQLNEVNLLENILGQHLTLEQYNIKIIEHFLQKNNQNVLKTAQDLGIGKTTIYRYINEGKIHLK